jgi:splicing factor 3B subunit 2
LSDDLRTALGMPVGPNAHKVPPPWLIAMQRYGPPPSYPNLKIPGLNAPIPDGCSFGYHAGGWGKPPVDELGKPLYGDVFGTSDARTAMNAAPAEEIDTTLWGEMESESEEETDSEEDEEEEEEGEGGEGGEDTGLQTPVVGGDGGMATPSGTTSTIGGEFFFERQEQ